MAESGLDAANSAFLNPHTCKRTTRSDGAGVAALMMMRVRWAWGHVGAGHAGAGTTAGAAHAVVGEAHQCHSHGDQSAAVGQQVRANTFPPPSTPPPATAQAVHEMLTHAGALPPRRG
jgi:hypothetical protein